MTAIINKVKCDPFHGLRRKITGPGGQEICRQVSRDLRGNVAADPHYSKHVEGPQRPIAVKNFGAVSVAELRRLHDARRAEIRETVRGRGGKRYRRRLKCDFPTLYIEIHSHPMTTEDYKTASPEARAQVGAWANTALKDFVSWMPEGVRFAAVVHLDEAHVHFHILAVNMADPKMSANKLHVGKIAAEKWRQENGSSTTLEALPRPAARTSRENRSRVKTAPRSPSGIRCMLPQCQHGNRQQLNRDQTGRRSRKHHA